MRKNIPGASKAIGSARLAATLSIAMLLPGCYGGMMIAAVGLEMEEHRAARESKQREKRINKLPPDEQAIVRLWHVRSKHSSWGGYNIKEQELVDVQTMLNVTKMVILAKRESITLEIYDQHFAEFGYNRLTPPAPRAIRSYKLNDYRVDLRMVNPSEINKTVYYSFSKHKPEDYTDLIIRVYSPRKAAEKRMR